MEKAIERIEGDTAGISYELAVYRFKGSSADAPRTYIQAALHGDEFPGVVAIHELMPQLRRAEAESRILGDITVVPWANPIGRGQYLFGEQQGRFHLGTRTNFNRDFPLLERPDPALLGADASTADARLKQRLLKLSLGHDIVLDLHCDDEGVVYLYVPQALWPAMADCAAAMGVQAVVLWSGESGAAFEEASVHPHLQTAEDRLERIVVTTVEYRGVIDVDPKLAKSDAAGLYRLLVARGVVSDPAQPPLPAYAGVVAPLENIEMVETPRAGAILYHVRPGDRVARGDRLATIVHTPGEEDGSVDVFAPQAGFILTRRAQRTTRAGDDLIKLVGERRSDDARSGTLED